MPLDHVSMREGEKSEERVWLAAVRRRIKQHEDALVGWSEPAGLLVPTEPDPATREQTRLALTVAIEELRRLCADMGRVP